jgi:hypothetical protein
MDRREEFKKIDISLDRLGYWWTVFGPIGVLSVLMSGIATGFTFIAQYGWGAIVFAGVGAACVVMFSASALMVSWRYFEPLPNQPATPGEGQEVSTQDMSTRLAEAERGMARNKAALEEVRTKAAMLTRSLRARDAQSTIKEADQVIMSTYKKLLEEAYPDEATWADDYAAWEKTMSRIDNLMSQWTQQHHEPFLDIRLKDFEPGAPLPQHIKSDVNMIRYKTAWLAQSSYANRREGLFGYFAAIIGDI